MKSIQIACDARDSLPLDQIEPFQDDLKEIDPADLAILCAEITTTGFAFPVHVWRKSKRSVKAIGGHQRLKALAKLRDDGWSVPDVPVIFVHAKTEKEAARRVLQDVAQYARVTEPGLQGFTLRHGLNLDEIRSSFRMPDLEIAGMRPGALEGRTVTFDARPNAVHYESQYGVIVVCDSEAQQKKVFDRLQSEGLTCKVVVT